MYDIIAPFSESKQFSIKLQNMTDSQDCLEFGAVKLYSGIMFARYNGSNYVGYNHANPSSFDKNGICIQKHTTGVTMDSLIAIFSQFGTPTLFQSTSRDEWSATFEILETGNGALRIAVRLSSPFAGSEIDSFRDEFLMHEFA